jgi:hypothetical protein
MNIENLLQIGFAGAIAIYLVIFLVKDVKGFQTKSLEVQDKIVNTLDKIVEMLRTR